MRMRSVIFVALSAFVLSSAAIAAKPANASRNNAQQANAQGTPQRDPTPPAGLLRAFQRGVPGIQRAIVATQGSNSRLQDLPASP